jgi:hypothetical protein
MSLGVRRREVARAERRLSDERRAWHLRTLALRRYFLAHRSAWAVGGGLATGLLAGALPLRGAARFAGLLARMAAFAIRLPLSALLFERVAQTTVAATSAPPADPPA